MGSQGLHHLWRLSPLYMHDHHGHAVCFEERPWRFWCWEVDRDPHDLYLFYRILNE